MVGLDRPRLVDALQPSSITVYKTRANGISDGKVNLRPQFLMGTRIKWQPWYLWTDGAARLNSDVCFYAIAGARWSLARRAPEVSIQPQFGASLSKSSIKSSAYRTNRCPELPAGCWSYSRFLSISKARPELYVIVIRLTCCLGLTWDLLLLSADEDKHQCWCVIHLIYCSWFNLIKCAVWLNRSK